MKGHIPEPKKRPFISQKGESLFSLFIKNVMVCFVQACLLIWTVSRVSNVAHGPLLLICSRKPYATKHSPFQDMQNHYTKNVNSK